MNKENKSKLNFEPVIKEVEYDSRKLTVLKQSLHKSKDKNHKYLFEYPTVYIINSTDKKSKNYDVYIGETNNIERRTVEHLTNDTRDETDQRWNRLSKSNSSKMLVIGDPIFNKSLTLDIENKLMLYMSAIEHVNQVFNRRTNEQSAYYTSEFLDNVFSEIWLKLNEINKTLFPIEQVVRDSAMFKASPFHKLDKDQTNLKNSVYLKLIEIFSRDEDNQLIVISGDAGTGKTVLLSSLFYDLSMDAKDPESVIFGNKNNYLLVNHDEQVKVYDEIMTKLGLHSKNHPVVMKPTSFINNKDIEKADVVLIDEAHLLWTQGKQSYQGKDQLADIRKKARVVIMVYDPSQVLTAEQYRSVEEVHNIIQDAGNNMFHLLNQKRIHANKTTVAWIRNLIDNHEIGKLMYDEEYDLQIMDTPEELERLIRKKASDEKKGLSRIIATFDWEYKNAKAPEDKTKPYWYVEIGDWKMPWNLQLPAVKKNKKYAWAEIPESINEVGSTFTIQGADLNYAGVIIGPSVKYRNGRIITDKTASKSKKATNRRTLKNGEKKDFAEKFLNNELNVLLTRGVNGMYIYAVDDELRAALKKNVESKK
ncbi:hypothetical protein FC62_GL000096 [Amylolactobacillus amylotrophicus DSM 20534]|uniref:ATP-dependent exonuclease n=3 Tax=Amylolactobacillus TaxID=2767876 RepID=A0A1L6XA96_9LACO|nr:MULTISPECIES: DUF2075 domain-containing protein [Amylolactobacillus]APT17882.1 ATP-dependent exonuclease [Amylolactobacillus amylophilus DSM 20533 = JCM 1125]KRK38412.1 hypothetical protein FC62_GL000096 [Amylolactobacillus amylotrophicus DSM 20534]KRM42945.1 hypothetical protein FD40_GL000743 [Amylolactobacillus amylophilus DSM 20533 = JCM 1125]GED79811.1 hypothetical protein LAM01_02840 [Amylolactobacillus amylophilus]